MAASYSITVPFLPAIQDAPPLTLPDGTSVGDPLGQSQSQTQSTEYSLSDPNYHIWTAVSVAGIDMSSAQQATLFDTWRNSEWVAPGAPTNAPDGEEIDLPESLHVDPTQ
jgi:hypothetical protein